jgi:hypothetical protein
MKLTKKEKKSIYDKERRVKIGEKLREHSRKYYKKNKDTTIKEYRKENREKILLYNRIYNAEHKESIREYIKRNWDKYLERAKQQKKKDIIKVRARNWAKLHNQRGDKCNECGSREKLEFHHTDYINRKGITLCKKCHINKHQTKLKGDNKNRS